MKKILFIFIIFFSTLVNSSEKIIILATVNNISITNKDLQNEILIIKVLNNFKEIDKKILQQSAFQNLLELAIKEVELTINKIEIKSAKIYNKIKKRSQIEYAWNVLISSKYSWKLNINTNEIQQKLIALGYVDPNNPETIKEKEKLIAQEKNKKFNFYSRAHLEQAKRELLIKIIK
jgi:hypothetical protein